MLGIEGYSSIEFCILKLSWTRLAAFSVQPLTCVYVLGRAVNVRTGSTSTKVACISKSGPVTGGRNSTSERYQGSASRKYGWDERTGVQNPLVAAINKGKMRERGPLSGTEKFCIPDGSVSQYGAQVG